MSIFTSLRTPRIKKTAFNLSYANKLSCNMGPLVPVFCKEVLPGDKWRVQTTTLIRFNPLKSPVMDNIDAYIHYFFVPNRLLMPSKDWETFITGGKTGEETAQLPYLTLDDLVKDGLGGVGSLADYLGYPVNQTYIAGSGLQNIDLEGNPLRVSTLPLRAYQLIWQEYYRDQNLTDEIFDFQNALPDDGNQADYTLDDLLLLRNRAWKKDYFTSALPFVQRGAPAGVNVTTEVDGDTAQADYYNYSPTGTSTALFRMTGQYGSESNHYLSMDNMLSRIDTIMSSEGFTNIRVTSVTGGYGDDADEGRRGIPQARFVVEATDPDTQTTITRTFPADVTYNTPHTHGIDSTSQSSTITINDLRRAESLQSWLERNARGGARYIEQILSHFGVVSSDARLQRPEYLGGGRQPITISEVLQTSASDNVSQQGNMAGHGVSAGTTMRFKRRFEEHGFIIGIMSVMPHASYSQGCPKSLTRFDKLDYAFPEFAHLGEQPVLDRELYINGTSTGDGTFGYQSVYADYKFSNDEIHGDFKTSLNYWHMGRIFASKPSLNESFITSRPTQRIFAVDATEDTPNSHKLWCELYHNVQAIRPLPKYGTPMMSI